MNTRIPEFKTALGSDWDKLPQVILDHYDIPNKFDRLVVKGVMDEVQLKPILRLAMPVLRFLGALVARPGKNVPTTLINYITSEKEGMQWERTFHFPDGDETFFTKMVADGSGQIIEYVKFGLGIRLKVWVEDDCLHYLQKSYVLNLFDRLKLPFPNWLGLGTGWIKESVVDQETFRVDFGIDHPLLGKVFGYSGNFKIVEKTTD